MSSRATEVVDLIIHEMRTPISVAIGSLRQLGPLADPAHQAAVDRAVRSCVRLERLAAELRDWSRVTQERPAPVAHRLCDLVRDAATAAAIGGAPGARLHVADCPDVVVTALHGLPDALGVLVDAMLRAAGPDEVVGGEVSVDDSTAVLTLCRPDHPPADADGPFDAELIRGLGFGLPLAAATIEGGAGRIASRCGTGGRLEALTVRLALAAPSR